MQFVGSESNTRESVESIQSIVVLLSTVFVITN